MWRARECRTMGKRSRECQPAATVMNQRLDTENLGKLTLESTLAELHLDHFEIDCTCLGQDLEQAFQDNPLLPGVVLRDRGQFLGTISRRSFLETLSSPYGREIFLRRPLSTFCDLVYVEDAVLPISTPIATAARQCLQRSPELLNEPVTVQLDDSYRLLDFHHLLVAQAQIYELAMRTIEERNAALDLAYAEIAQLNAQLQSENIRMSAELNVAKRLQETILPKPLELDAIEDLDIAGYMDVADEVGGDYYDVLKTENGAIFGIGDVTGHGFASGIVMLMAQTAIRTLQESADTDLKHFLSVLNRTIFRNVERMNFDKNMTLALLAYSKGKLQISGQHEEVIAVRAGGKIELIDTLDLGFPIALDDEIADFIATETIDLHPGDGFVLYTDGITEAENSEGEQFGLDRLCKVVGACWQRPAAEIVAETIAQVRAFIGEQTVYDDLTLLIVKQK